MGQSGPQGTPSHRSQHHPLLRPRGTECVVQGDYGPEEGRGKTTVVLLVIPNSVNRHQGGKRRRSSGTTILMVGACGRYIADAIPLTAGPYGEVRLLGIEEEPLLVPLSHGIVAVLRDKQSRASCTCHVVRRLVGTPIPNRLAQPARLAAVSYTHLRAHETRHDLV